MMKKIIALTAVLVTSGCHTSANQIRQQGIETPGASEIKSQCESQTPPHIQEREIQLWLCQAVTAIQYRFFDADTYRGKTCDVRIRQPAGEAPVSIRVQAGDPALCTAAIESIKQAVDAHTFPMRPAFLKDEIPIHFAPQ
ncbi:cell envelope integrity TolA C-terminal domain-containing protein [Pantoea vagans]|uniref:cell envelope integrity TolA C-terminal domain-containing protein n=1 Tax=Pantoea vagans TaxID=470934 RepID=UPI00289BDC3C|nr:cell envelope integrity TolA C-terminal domain-containing protein [Pantoea vagans]